MYYRFLEYIDNFKSKIKPIPFILRTLSLIFLVFTMFILAAIPYPGMNYTINGESVTYTEFLKNGAVFVFLIVGIVSPICGYTILNRKKWGRYILLLSFAVPSVILPLINTTSFLQVINLLPSVLFSLVVYWYLFVKETVVSYYNNRDIIN